MFGKELSHTFNTHKMKEETLHPEFFKFDDKRVIELSPVYIAASGRKFKQTLVTPNLIASIPMYSFEQEGSRKRKKMEKEWLEEKLKRYNKIKKVYDENIFVGAVFCGVNKCMIKKPINDEQFKRSCKITKIVINDKEGIGYVCYKASDESIELINKENALRRKEFEKKNKKNKNDSNFELIDFKPIANGKFSLITFLSALNTLTPYLQIINNPNKIKK